MSKSKKHLEVTVPVPWSPQPVRFILHTPLGVLAWTGLALAAFLALLLVGGR